MEASKRQYYEMVLADLEAQKRELELSILLLRRRLGVAEGVDMPPLPELSGALAPGEIPADAFAGMSIGEAAKKFLRLKKQRQSTAQIVSALEKGGLAHDSENFTATVSSVLSREARRGDGIVRVARGEWSLGEWESDSRLKRPARDPLAAPPTAIVTEIIPDA